MCSTVSPQHAKEVYAAQLNYASDNVDISRHPVSVGYVSSLLLSPKGSLHSISCLKDVNFLSGKRPVIMELKSFAYVLGSFAY